MLITSILPAKVRNKNVMCSPIHIRCHCASRTLKGVCDPSFWVLFRVKKYLRLKRLRREALFHYNFRGEDICGYPLHGNCITLYHEIFGYNRSG